MFRVAISGAIAVGKTTIIQQLQILQPTWGIAEEIVERNRFLDRFYGDPKRWALHSRIEFLSLKGQELADSLQHERAGDGDDPAIVLFDRSLPELVTFARVMHGAGTLEDDEFELYYRLYALMRDSLPAFDATVWLRADAQVCLGRIGRRGRPFEQGIGVSYLDSLDDAYQGWFNALSEPKLMVDTSRGDIAQVSGRVAEWIVSNAR